MKLDTPNAGFRRVVGFGVGVALVSWMLTGCGPTNISTSSAKSALHAAGFDQLVVYHEQPDAPDTNRIGNYSIIESRIYRPWPVVELLRYRSRGAAARVYPGFSRAYFRGLVAYWRHPTKLCNGCYRLPLPRGFQMRKIVTFRICNVILWSYNSQLDPRLTARVKRAVTLMWAKCS